jgi:hypothetical protein
MIYGVVKIFVISVMRFHTIKMVIYSEPISDSSNICPDSVRNSSNLVSTDVSI